MPFGNDILPLRSGGQRSTPATFHPLHLPVERLFHLRCSHSRSTESARADGNEGLTNRAAKQIFVDRLDHPSSHDWNSVVGANPAYDAFPMQHQVFYPVKDKKCKSGSLWYDPVFCFETIPDNEKNTF
mmetsp:Transcript_48123/g.58032  ORF Transcript_48123/g.58032 Transcript_48123/m.58032 type:complete len:128 (-) Transcript_48123:23-406(-)